MKLDPEFLILLPQLKKKLFHGRVERFGIQKYWFANSKFQFDWENRSPVNQDFEDHFYRDGINRGNRIEAALGFVPLQQDDIITKITIDCDTQEHRDFVFKEVIPKYDKMGIDHFEEHGGNPNKFDRVHCTVLTKCKLELVKAFYRQFFAELEEPILGYNDEQFLGKKVRFKEIYGINKVNVLCRWFYGFNAKPERNKRFPCEYKGDDLDDVVSVVKAILDMKPLTEEFLLANTRDDFFPASIIKPEIKRPMGEGFKFQDLNLPLPIDYVPPEIQPVFKNCQALNGILMDAVHNHLLEDEGHDSGLALARTFRFLDVRDNIKRGREAFDRLLSEYRSKSAKKHNWWHGQDKAYYSYIYRCDKYNEILGRCDGCPFKGRINSPREFLIGTTIKRNILPSPSKLVTIEHIRENTFPKFQEYVVKLVKQNLELKRNDIDVTEPPTS